MFDRDKFKKDVMDSVKSQKVDQTSRLLMLLDILADAEERRTSKLRPEVLAFANVMEEKLRLKDAEKGASGWKNTDPKILLGMLSQEMFELENALRCNSGARDVAFEAADVGNFAMMIVDVTGGLKPQ